MDLLLDLSHSYCRKFPTLSFWTTQSVKERIKEELQTGGFEKGKVVDRIKNVKDDKNEAEESEDDVNQGAEIFKSINVKKDFVENVSVVLKKMAEAMVEFEVMVEIGRVHQMSGILKKIFTSVSKMFNSVSSSQGEEETDTDIEKHDEDDDDFFNYLSFFDTFAELKKAIKKDENGQQEKETNIVAEVDVVAEQAQQVFLELETPVIEVRDSPKNEQSERKI
ncbi:conserved hypothetical protein [Ricinus communis]|uniref:Uncharacterized protein n=1 Tax=Ricinus communis TaxID=3988 RepID=B9S0T9_RICCO|nr:conserved hypothetical protein [Ricinus communis]